MAGECMIEPSDYRSPDAPRRIGPFSIYPYMHGCSLPSPGGETRVDIAQDVTT